MTTLGSDAAALLTDLGVLVDAVEPLPRLDVPANRTSSHRVRLTDGRSVKVTEGLSERRATTVELAFQHLALDALPRWLGRHRGAVAFEWVEGDTVAELDERVLRTAGRVLATIHDSSPLELQAEPRLEPHGAADRLDAHLASLVDVGVLEAGTAQVLARWARAHVPMQEASVLLHIDLCPENVVLHDGALRIVDNGSWSVGPRPYDLARTTWRWPMTPGGRAAWLNGYALGASPPTDLTDLPFWLVVAATGGVAYRLGGAPDLLEPEAERLRRLAELEGLSGRELVDACPT